MPYQSGEKHPMVKLTEQKVREIRALIAKGVSRKVIAKKFNVSESCIGRIKSQESWGHLK